MLLTLKVLRWSNWFSYGADNEVKLNETELTQVLGLNGSGKSSIPLILEELLFGKNSKNIKKQDIGNRFLKTPEVKAELEFSKDEVEYKIVLSRKSTLKISLYEDGEDISSHTSKDTYKMIEDIIGIDFKIFSQLIYQSSKSGLEFLTATDTQRKTFLIKLFNLEEYTKYYELFKEEYRVISKRVSSLEGSVNTITKWIESHQKDNLEPMELLEEPAPIQDGELLALKVELTDIDKTNKNINKNNEYKKMLKGIDYDLLTPVMAPDDDKHVVGEVASLQTEMRQLKAKIDKVEKLKGKCPTCLQDIDLEFQTKLMEEAKAEYNKCLETKKAHEEWLKGNDLMAKDYRKHMAAVAEFEKLTTLIDESMPSEIIDESALKQKIKDVGNEILAQRMKIAEVKEHNQKATKHNAEIEYIGEQLEKYEKELNDSLTKLESARDSLNSIDILRKSFSTSGLVSYKIEFLVKDLENEINNYLSELSYGRFQIEFALSGEKLNVNIIDNGDIIAITALSSGELARVNISTLLAIRKLMAQLSKTKINLLFLDEVMGVLDSDGREKLIEILLEEHGLNTFLVSHEYTHPLLEKIQVVKEENISRIENG